MNIIVSIGELVLLALILLEVQSLVRAVLLAYECPRDVQVSHNADGLQTAQGPSMTASQRLRFALAQYMLCSVLFHEHMRVKIGAKPLFRTQGALVFGGLIALFGYGIELSFTEATSLSSCASLVLFLASHARGLIKAYALGQESEQQVRRLQQRV